MSHYQLCASLWQIQCLVICKETLLRVCGYIHVHIHGHNRVIPNLEFRHYKFSVSYFVMSHTTECTLCLCVYIHVHIRGRMYVYAYISSILLPTVFQYLQQKRHERGLLFMRRPNELEMKGGVTEIGFFWYTCRARLIEWGSFDGHTGLFWWSYRALLMVIHGSFDRHTGLVWETYQQQPNRRERGLLDTTWAKDKGLFWHK